MNVLVYFSPETLSNSYVIFPDDGSDAILIDPRGFDVPLFKLVESRQLSIRSVLLTHATTLASKTIRTLKRIYTIDVFAGTDVLDAIKINNVHDIKSFSCSGLTISAIAVPGHFADSLMYLIDDKLFSGDVLLAGTMSRADGSYGRALMIQQTREICASLPGYTTVLPLYGPPSTIAIERTINLDLTCDEDPGL